MAPCRRRSTAGTDLSDRYPHGPRQHGSAMVTHGACAATGKKPDGRVALYQFTLPWARACRGIRADVQILGAKRKTAVIPIVISSAADPVGNGLVASLARPGGNVTGLSLALTETTGKRLELLRDCPSCTAFASLSKRAV